MKRQISKWTLATIATMVPAATWVPAAAFAALPEDINTEVQGYVTALAPSSDLDVRQGVTMARGYLNDQEPQAASLQATKVDPKIQLRVAAVFAAAESGDAEANAFLIDQLKQPQANEALYDQVISIFPDGYEVELLKTFIGDETVKNRGAVLGYLSRQNGPLFELFRAQLLDPKQTKDATKYAIRNRSKQMIPVAKQMLEHSDAEVQKQGLSLLTSLAAIPGVWFDAKPLFVTASSSKNAEIAKAATMQLVEHHEKEGLQPTLKAVAAATDDAATQALLLQALADNDYQVAKSVVDPYLKSKDQGVKMAAYILAAKDPEVQAEIMKMVRSTEFEDRLIGLTAAGSTDLDAAANYLAKSLFEARKDVRTISANGLKNLKKPSSLAALKQAMKTEKDPQIKQTVIEAIGEIGTDDAVTTLIFGSRDRNAAVRGAVVRALGASKNQKAIPDLERLMKDRNREIQWDAFLGLLSLDARVAAKYFETVFRNPSDTFMIDINQQRPDVRKLVYEYLLTKNNGRGRDEALAQAIATGEFDKEISRLAMDDSLLPKVRRRILTFLADRGAKKDLMILETVARTSKKPEISQYAAWLLLRAPQTREATLRGFLAGKDDKKKAVATIGVVLNHKTVDKKGKKKRKKTRRKSKKK